MEITTEPAMIATCGTCKAKSAPLDQEGIKEFAELHERQHEFESRRKLMASRGHHVTFEVKSTSSKTTGWPVCTCGWSGKPGKIELMTTAADEHLLENIGKA